MSLGLFAKGVQRPLRTVWKVKSGYRSVSYWWPKEESDCSEKPQNGTKPSKVLLMIPVAKGNPGLPEYYIEFMSHIHENLGSELDIVLTTNKLVTTGKNFGLQHQVQHKLECLDALVEKYPANTEFFLVGHSVGAWICEQVVKKRPNVKNYPNLLLVSCTPKASRNRKMFLFPPLSRNIIGKLVWGINLLPMNFMVRTISVLAKQSLKNALITSLILQLPCEARLLFLLNPSNTPSVSESVLIMAHDEMEQIYEVDKDFYFTIYYGVGDKWVPVESYHEMKETVASENIFLCSEDIPHAFVLGHSSVMAKKMVGWLSKYI
ncbi:hypothetical protein DSO57_1026535 [Entomophthora muscae]|uniref:Uncharacterized protein n=1 Tax=Entomophthora muscae TaxID=34485 RepID=A0ACC2T255_9FUNG|nr:hypothetical protein DSO57_1026535 [Entomophthora muscae]